MKFIYTESVGLHPCKTVVVNFEGTEQDYENVKDFWSALAAENPGRYRFEEGVYLNGTYKRKILSTMRIKQDSEEYYEEWEIDRALEMVIEEEPIFARTPAGLYTTE